MYHIVMKYIFLAIFVLIATQPVQVMSCDMHDDARQTSQNAHHDMNHDVEEEMDCCDHDPSVPTHQCDSMSHCGAGTTGALAFNSLSVNEIFKTVSRLYLHDPGEPLSRFNPPPYKPPIV